MTPDIGQILAAVAPVLVAVAGGFFGYRQAVKVADRSSATEGRKLTLSEYESLNRGLQAEIDRLRGDRVEDEDRFDRRVAGLEARIDRLERQRSDAETSLHRLLVWARMVLTIARRAEVAEALALLGVEIPAPPSSVMDTHDQLRPIRRAADG